MGFLDRYLIQDKSLKPVEPVKLSIPKALGKRIPESVRKIVSSPAFKLTATHLKENRLGVVSLDPETFTAKNHQKLLEQIALKAQDETVLDFIQDENAEIMEHCMSCGCALMSHDETEMTTHISLKIESRQKGKEVVAGEVGFCSWTHLVDYLTVCNSDARLWMFAGFLIPGTLRADGVKPEYMLRMQKRF